MSEEIQKQRLLDLLDYVRYLGELNQKPAFTVDGYKSLKYAEEDLRGKIGIHHDVPDGEGGSAWLKIERLHRIAPPPTPKEIEEWVSVSNDPELTVEVKDKLVRTMSEKAAEKLVEEGRVAEEDVREILRTEQHGVPKQKDVIFRLDKQPDIKAAIEEYINEHWYEWAEDEKPRRKTIKIYDGLFSLQQTMETHAEEQALEMVWGMGVGRWNCEGHKIDHPILEKLVEIAINTDDGSISITPRNTDPNVAIGPYFAMDIPGVEPLLRFSKKHFKELSEDVEVSPFYRESFEPVLRQAASQLSKSGTYWPDINKDRENRGLPDFTDELQVTDTWMIYARPRSVTSLIQDIERFKDKVENDPSTEISTPAKRLVTELSTEKPNVSFGGFGEAPSASNVAGSSDDSEELLFPKPFNDAQVQIVERLRQNDGVVVQGPPGTGKTHTIANIICHYLAHGKSVLVTSKGEPALSVLRDQIPEDIRDLTISLLTNERQGLKQLEAAVRLLAGVVSQKNLRDLKHEVTSYEHRVKDIKQRIGKIDTELKEWGTRQLTEIEPALTGLDSRMTAMQLATLVVADKSEHSWLPDKLGPSDRFDPQFSNDDIVSLRDARQALGLDIVYVGKSLPTSNDLPDSANIGAIHEDLVNATKLGQNAENEGLPPLVSSVSNFFDRAEEILPQLKDLLRLSEEMDQDVWLRGLFDRWVKNGLEHEDLTMVEETFPVLTELVERRKAYIKIPLNVPDLGSFKASVETAIDNLIAGKKAFGIFGLGKNDQKQLLEKIEVNGEYPKSSDDWQHVKDYLKFQDDVRIFIVRWNSVGVEYDLPELEYRFGDLIKNLHDLLKKIDHTIHVATIAWPAVYKELGNLFPHGLNVRAVLHDKSEVKRAIKAIETYSSRIKLSSQRDRLKDIRIKLSKSDGEIVEKLRGFVDTNIGSQIISSDSVVSEWQSLLNELGRINDLKPHINTVARVSDAIAGSGAPIWADKLRREVSFESKDSWTPDIWADSWRWRRQEAYIESIDSRERIKHLTSERAVLDNDLKKTFSNLVKTKTYIGLHQNMSERVQGALMSFIGAISRIGKGTGKRAPRHRREAFKAMEQCYDGVPCWIMPTWRISESLPSEFGSFDLVIIDEASQSDISALPAIMRAKKLLVVGDDRQVSPTAAFTAEEIILQLKHNFLKDQPFAELMLPGVSVYDLASSTFPSQRIMLTEHFRCVEPIIRFSMQFYDEPLIPLRMPESSKRLDPPLIDVYVPDGRRDEKKKVNWEEVDAIVNEIANLVEDPEFRERTIGVISMIGMQQAKAIQDLLITLIGEEAYQRHQIACGDSATFQGKEKDIIFLSMVVGSRQGAVMTKREYAQRFNVAMSRARDRMYLFRSVSEEDLKNDSDLRLKVIQHFKNPMPNTQTDDDPLALCDSDFERDVFKRLAHMGYFVTPQVPVGPYRIDMVVEGENDKRLAIELDGDKYHPPEKWLEDFSRQRTMERVGWTFWRCWGSSYALDPGGCIDDLVTTMNGMGIKPVNKSSHKNIYTEFREIRNENNEPYVTEEVGDDVEQFRLI